MKLSRIAMHTRYISVGHVPAMAAGNCPVWFLFDGLNVTDAPLFGHRGACLENFGCFTLKDFAIAGSPAPTGKFLNLALRTRARYISSNEVARRDAGAQLQPAHCRLHHEFRGKQEMRGAASHGSPMFAGLKGQWERKNV